MDEKTRSPAAFAWPAPGRGSSIKSFGVNLSSPVFKLNSDIWADGMPAGGEDINGSCAANPRSATPGNHMLVSLVKPVRKRTICTIHFVTFTRLSPRRLLRPRPSLFPRYPHLRPRPRPTSLLDRSHPLPPPSKNPTAPSARPGTPPSSPRST